MDKNKKNLSGYGFSFKDYIKILENPDKIGLNNGIWSAPILKGYDKNQRGYGIDINTNKKAKALTNDRPGRWLTEKEADTLMDDHINYITEAANKHIKGFSELPFRRRWALLGMLYRGDSVNKSGININEPNDLKFFKSISDYYRSKGLNTRANSSDEFFNRPLSKLLSMFKLKNGGQIRKMLTAAGGPLFTTLLKFIEDLVNRRITRRQLNSETIKRLRDGYRYVKNEKTGNWDRISDNPMSDVFSTLEVTPSGTRSGSSITRTLLPKTSNYRSAYHPEDALEFINIMTMGGLNNLSPTLWARRYIDLNKLLASKIARDNKMTWGKFTDSWINGNNGIVTDKFAKEHPYWSMVINGVGDVTALGGIANASKINKTIEYVPKISKVALDVAKSNEKPLNLRNYGFLRDSRFYSDLDNYGIRNIMFDRSEGNYPLTFSERRNYISNFKKDILSGVDYAKLEAVENLNAPLKKEVITSPGGFVFDLGKSDIKTQPTHFGTSLSTKVFGKTPWEGDYGAFLNHTTGLYFPFRNKSNTLRTHSGLETTAERRGVGAHETRHTILDQFDIPLVERRYDMPGSYGRYTNRKLPLEFKKKVNSFISDAGTAGEWEGSLAEMDAELTNWGAQYGIPSKYSLMNPQLKAKIVDLFLKRFGGNTDYTLYNDVQGIFNSSLKSTNNILKFEKNIDNSKIGEILKGLELLGYRKQGGKMNILEFLKNGSGIHIKKENRGKFTDYCGGKVTSECIAKGKRSSNPAIRKRATFAANARKWKHKDGGSFKGYPSKAAYDVRLEEVAGFKKGGKAFVNGVSILDSNPDAYKYVKKKMKKAAGGTKLNNETILTIGKTALNGILGFIQTTALNNNLLKLADALKAQNKVQPEDFWSMMELEANLEVLNEMEQAAAIKAMTGLTINVNPDMARNKVWKKVAENYSRLKKAIDDLNKAIDAQVEAQKQSAWGNLAGSLILSGIGLLGNYLGNKTSTNNTSSNSGGWTMNYNSLYGNKNNYNTFFLTGSLPKMNSVVAPNTSWLNNNPL